MKYFSTIAMLALFLGSTQLTAAQTMLKYSEINQIGDPAEVVELKEHSSQPLKSGEVRVRVLAAPINPSNLLQIAGNYGTDAVLPSTPGSEGVGRVLETSAEVKHLAVGQLVLMAGAGGTWRDEMVAPAAGFIPLPELGPIGSDVIEQLSMSVVNPITALLMLTTFVDVKEGQWIVQSASNSAVGGYVIQLAKQRGIKTINVVRREGLAEELMAKGADVVLIDGPDLAAQIASAANNEPVVLALDAVGGDTYTRLANSLGQGGTLVAYGMLSGKPAMLNTGMAIFKDLRTRGFWLSKWYETAERKDQQAAFGQVIPLIAQGILKADIDSRFTVAEIKQAVTRAGQRGRNGKVLIVPKVD
jgi:NADPH:quinone reductase-like Zn-dependent oxidoreductase